MEVHTKRPTATKVLQQQIIATFVNVQRVQGSSCMHGPFIVSSAVTLLATALMTTDFIYRATLCERGMTELSSCVRPSAHPSALHKPVLYRNDWTKRARFWRGSIGGGAGGGGTGPPMTGLRAPCALGPPTLTPVDRNKAYCFR